MNTNRTISLTYEEYVGICQELRAAAALHRETAASLTSYELAMKFVDRAKRAEALAQAVAARYFGQGA